MVSARDITALVEAQAERVGLAKRERDLDQHLSRTLEALTDGFVTLAKNLAITFMNRGCETILEIDRATILVTILGKPLSKAYPAMSERAFATQYRHALDTSEAMRFTNYFAPLASGLKSTRTRHPTLRLFILAM